MTIYDLKPRFQALLRPLVDKLAAVGVTANQVTIAAMILSIVTGLNLAINPENTLALIFVPVVMFVRMALNAIDGMLAREHDMQTSLGAILNELSDVLSDVVLYLPFALIPGLSPIIITIVVVLAIISEMAGVVAVQIGASRRYDGPMGKSDRAFVFGLIAFLTAFGIFSSGVFNWLLVAVVGATMLTIWNRCASALKELD